MVNSFSAGVSFPVFFWPFGGGLASAEIFRRARGHKAALSRRDAPELHMITCRSSIMRAQGKPGAGWLAKFVFARNAFLRVWIDGSRGCEPNAL
jgi:hypothetical protein